MKMKMLLSIVAVAAVTFAVVQTSRISGLKERAAVVEHKRLNFVMEMLCPGKAAAMEVVGVDQKSAYQRAANAYQDCDLLALRTALSLCNNCPIEIERILLSPFNNVFLRTQTLREFAQVEEFERFDPNAGEGGIRWYKVSQDYRRDYHENTMNRQNCAAFSAGGRGYVVGGQRSSGSVLGDTWEYIPRGGRYKRGVWTQRASIEGASRYGAVGFSYNDIGFVACGQRGSDASSYFEDVWSFYPQEDYDKHTYK